MDSAEITGLILAGGRGSRMGNVDKGLQIFRGGPMALHVMMRLQPQVGAMMINANRNLGPYESFGLPVWPDEIGGFEGPLAGMQTGLAHCETEYMATAPCDSPFLPEDLVARLAEGMRRENAELAYAYTGEGDARQSHPVFCLMRATLVRSLEAYLRSGGRKIEAWFRQENAAQVRFEEEAAFRNINTLEDLKRYEAP